MTAAVRAQKMVSSRNIWRVVDAECGLINTPSSWLLPDTGIDTGPLDLDADNIIENDFRTLTKRTA